MSDDIIQFPKGLKPTKKKAQVAGTDMYTKALNKQRMDQAVDIAKNRLKLLKSGYSPDYALVITEDEIHAMTPEETQAKGNYVYERTHEILAELKDHYATVDISSGTIDFNQPSFQQILSLEKELAEINKLPFDEEEKRNKLRRNLRNKLGPESTL
ncbi:MAG: hypothetical protein FWE31_00835 [Firmicutes bacterium]|nr:hypothetical protein [Bacillota bacterium]